MQTLMEGRLQTLMKGRLQTAAGRADPTGQQAPGARAQQRLPPAGCGLAPGPWLAPSPKGRPPDDLHGHAPQQLVSVQRAAASGRRAQAGEEAPHCRAGAGGSGAAWRRGVEGASGAALQGARLGGVVPGAARSLDAAPRAPAAAPQSFMRPP